MLRKHKQRYASIFAKSKDGGVETMENTRYFEIKEKYCGSK